MITVVYVYMITVVYVYMHVDCVLPIEVLRTPYEIMNFPICIVNSNRSRDSYLTALTGKLIDPVTLT